jgi:acetylglutamate kinase
VTGTGRGYSPELRANALVEALPYLQRFRGSVIVVKLGGNAIVDDDVLRTFAEDIVMLRSVGLKPVVVHGGGPQIGELLGRLGKETEFRNGLRVTDAETLNVARMVLVGQVGRNIIGHINMHGAFAVGMSGEDGRLIVARQRDPELGLVGDVDEIHPGIVRRLLAEDLIPVISSIGVDTSGQALNINADTVAGAIGGALGAEKVIFLTDVPGLLTDVDDPDSIIPRSTVDELRAQIESKVISGGMVPKVESCINAVEAGAASAHLLDGRVPHVLLLELFTDAGIGTMITAVAGSGEADISYPDAAIEEPRS